jgi:hypothetical protein
MPLLSLLRFMSAKDHTRWFIDCRSELLRLSRIYTAKKLQRRSFLTPLAKSTHFQPDYPDLEATLLNHLFFQFLERRTRVFHDRAAPEAGHVAVISIGFGLVIVLLALNVHQIQFIDQPTVFEQREGSIDRGAIDIRILFPGDLQKPSGVQMSGASPE